MKIIIDTYVYKVEVTEAPDGLKIGELKKIMGDVSRELARTAKVYWNPEKGYCEDRIAGRLMESSEGGITKTGFFKRYSWQLEFDWVTQRGKLAIKNA
jgi:hypothetical protein